MNSKSLTLFAVLSCFAAIVNAQTLASSNHPIVIVNTNGVTIPDEPKINGTMGIIYNGEGNINSINDSFNHYNGGIGIETRGNSTQDFEKKTYSLELRTEANEDTSVNLLGMGGEEDWILHAMVIDKSHLRIPLSFYLSQQMGHYAPDWRFVELIVNGDYRGLYILTERIKRDDDRVDIARLRTEDVSGDQLTGGYILRIDWLEDFEPSDGFQSNYNSQSGSPMTFQWYYPKANDIQPQQAQYIQNWMATFEEAVFSANFTNTQGTRYTDYINVESFTDFLLINEFSKNADGYKLSSYVHKDRDSTDGRLVAGPIWDFDQTYGVSEVCSNSDFTGWTYLQNQPACEDLESMPMWWQTMMQDTMFQNRLKCRWTEFRSAFLHSDSITDWINTNRTFISSAIDRNFTKWDDFIGESIWAEPEPVPQSYAEEIQVLQSWIQNRLTWMDNNLPGNCEFDFLSADAIDEGNTNIYPNPTSDILRVQINLKEAQEFRIYAADGRLAKSGSLNLPITEIDVADLSNGIYLIQIGQLSYRFVKSN